jgi:8-oxo-dGTP diphosphatase
MKIILVSAAALIDSEGRVLLAQRPEGGSMAGLWEFPGGKIEAGETPQQALVRELEEELGIETSTGCFTPVTYASHTYYRSPPPSQPIIPGLCPADGAVSWQPDIKDDFHLILLLFACRRWNDIPTPKEHAKLIWRKPSEMKGLPMPAADVPLIDALIDTIG